jgi:hypothetical protein
MIRRQIDLDEETDQILAGLAEEYQGDVGKALADLLHNHKTLEGFVSQCEEAQDESLVGQKGNAERGFREGRFTNWEEIKRHNKL